MPTSHSAATTSTRAAVATATIAAAAACWVVALQQMSGMDMGAQTELGTLGFFAAAWVPMMAAMMLPGAVPAPKFSRDAECLSQRGTPPGDSVRAGTPTFRGCHPL